MNFNPDNPSQNFDFFRKNCRKVYVIKAELHKVLKNRISGPAIVRKASLKSSKKYTNNDIKQILDCGKNTPKTEKVGKELFERSKDFAEAIDTFFKYSETKEYYYDPEKEVCKKRTPQKQPKVLERMPDFNSTITELIQKGDEIKIIDTWLPESFRTDSIIKRWIESKPKAIKVLILDPFGETLKTRHKSLDRNLRKLSDIQKEILDFCKSVLFEKSNLVEIKFYDQLNGGNAVIFGSNTFFSPFLDNIFARKTFSLHFKNFETSGAIQINQNFDNIWSKSNSIKVDQSLVNEYIARLKAEDLKEGIFIKYKKHLSERYLLFNIDEKTELTPFQQSIVELVIHNQANKCLLTINDRSEKSAEITYEGTYTLVGGKYLSLKFSKDEFYLKILTESLSQKNNKILQVIYLHHGKEAYPRASIGLLITPEESSINEPLVPSRKEKKINASIKSFLSNRYPQFIKIGPKIESFSDLTPSKKFTEDLFEEAFPTDSRWSLYYPENFSTGALDPNYLFNPIGKGILAFKNTDSFNRVHAIFETLSGNRYRSMVDILSLGNKSFISLQFKKTQNAEIFLSILLPIIKHKNKGIIGAYIITNDKGRYHCGQIVVKSIDDKEEAPEKFSPDTFKEQTTDVQSLFRSNETSIKIDYKKQPYNYANLAGIYSIYSIGKYKLDQSKEIKTKTIIKSPAVIYPSGKIICKSISYEGESIIAKGRIQRKGNYLYIELINEIDPNRKGNLTFNLRDVNGKNSFGIQYGVYTGFSNRQSYPIAKRVLMKQEESTVNAFKSRKAERFIMNSPEFNGLEVPLMNFFSLPSSNYIGFEIKKKINTISQIEEFNKEDYHLLRNAYYHYAIFSLTKKGIENEKIIHALEIACLSGLDDISLFEDQLTKLNRKEEFQKTLDRLKTLLYRNKKS